MELVKKRLKESFQPNTDQLMDIYQTIGGDSKFGNYLNFMKYSKNYIFIGNSTDFAIIDRVSTLVYRIKNIYSTSNSKNLLREILYFADSKNINIYGIIPFNIFTMAINTGFQTLEFNLLKNLVKNVIGRFESNFLVVTPDNGIKFNDGITKKYFFICNNNFMENIFY